jgi:hypothetical protein
MINIITSGMKEKPIFEWDGMPTFRTKSEEAAWWDRERNRWETGFGGLTGQHYFTITQGTYKNASNKYVRPSVRDGDMLVFEEYNECRRTMEDLFIAKRRGFALSSIFGAAIPMHASITYPGSTNLITSADKNRLEELYKDKAMVFYSEMQEKIKPSIVSSRQHGYLHFGKKVGNDITGLNSKILCIQTTESPKDATAFEAYRATTAFIDEVFLHPRPDMVVASTQASLQDGFRKINPVVLGGSCGVASTEGASKMQEYWLDAENNMVRTIFIPGTLCIVDAPELDEDGRPTGKMLNFCPNGRSNEKAAFDWIMTMRGRFEKAKNKKKLLQFIKAYPLSIEEVFDVNTQGVFTEDVMEMIQTASMRITKENYPVNRFDLIEDNRGGITARVNNSTGDFYILDHPTKDVAYGAGNDPIPFGQTDDITYRRSENAIVIGSLLEMKMHAYYSERTHDADLAASKMLLLLKYYNNACVLIERNRGGTLIDKIKNYGYANLLAPQPKFLGSSGYDKRIKHGWYKDAHSSILANAELVTYITKYSDRIYFKRLIDEIKVFIIENTDVADAWVSFLLYARDYYERLAKKANMNTVARETIVVTIKNGERIVERKKVYISDDDNSHLNRIDSFNHGR